MHIKKFVFILNNLILLYNLTMVRINLDVEVVGEHLLGIAAGGGQQVQAQHQEAGGEEVFGVGGKVKVEGTKSCCLLVGCWCCGGLAGGCSPPSCAARWWG